MGRNRTRVAAGLLGVAASVALGGCGGTSMEGSPVPAAASSAAATSGSAPRGAPSSSSAPSVHRPKKIDLTGVEACDLMRKLPLTELGFKPVREGARQSTSGGYPGNKECVVNGPDSGPGLLLIPVTNAGIDQVLARASGEVTRTEAAGFPAGVIRPVKKTLCGGVIDVADGQVLAVTISNAVGPDIPQDKLCERIPNVMNATVAAVSS